MEYGIKSINTIYTGSFFVMCKRLCNYKRYLRNNYFTARKGNTMRNFTGDVQTSMTLSHRISDHIFAFACCDDAIIPVR